MSRPSRSKARRNVAQFIEKQKAGGEAPADAQDDASRQERAEPVRPSGAAKKRPVGSPRATAKVAPRSGIRRKEPRVSADGKVDIYCPGCSSHYRVGEEGLESKLACKKCGRSFFAKNAAGRPPKKEDTAKYFLIGGGVLVVLVAIGFMISSGGGGEKKKKTVIQKEEKVATGLANPRVQAVIEWVEAIGRKDRFNAEAASDLDMLKSQLGIEAGKKIANLTPDDAAEVKAKVFEALMEGDPGLMLRDTKAESGSIDESMVDSNSGSVSLFMKPRPEGVFKAKHQAALLVNFVMDNSRLRVSGFTWQREPKYKREHDPALKGKIFVPHKEIAAPTKRETTLGGEKIEITESEIVPLGHLEDTAEETRTMIDDAIEQIIDLDLAGGASQRAIAKLKKLPDHSRAAIPRLLNKAYELSVDVDENNIRLSNLMRSLRTLTGASYGYNAADISVMGGPKSDIGATKEERVSALKQWYAFWYRWHGADYAAALQQTDEDLDAEMGIPKDRRDR